MDPSYSKRSCNKLFRTSSAVIFRIFGIVFKIEHAKSMLFKPAAKGVNGYKQKMLFRVVFIKKFLLIAVVLSLVIPVAAFIPIAAAQGVTMSSDMSANIEVYFDSLMHANFRIDGYAYNI